MVENIVLVAGATGNLGQKITRELIKNKATVRVLVRPDSDPKKTDALEKMGANIVRADMKSKLELIAACSGVSCIVSALAGLHEVIVDTQTTLLEAAITAGVHRFIHSNFSSDFTGMPPGENRNFDLRKEFHTILLSLPSLCIETIITPVLTTGNILLSFVSVNATPIRASVLTVTGLTLTMGSVGFLSAGDTIVVTGLCACTPPARPARAAAFPYHELSSPTF